MLTAIKKWVVGVFGVPSGPHAYHARGHTANPASGGINVVGLYTLPAGNYLVWVTIAVVSDEHVMTCTMMINGQPYPGPVGYTAIYSDHGASGQISMATFIPMPAGGSLVARCFPDGASGISGEITALKVESVNWSGVSAPQPGVLQ